MNIKQQSDSGKHATITHFSYVYRVSSRIVSKKRVTKTLSDEQYTYPVYHDTTLTEFQRINSAED